MFRAIEHVKQKMNYMAIPSKSKTNKNGNYVIAITRSKYGGEYGIENSN